MKISRPKIALIGNDVNLNGVGNHGDILCQRNIFAEKDDTVTDLNAYARDPSLVTDYYFTRYFRIQPVGKPIIR
jgi:hypothetical protein